MAALTDERRAELAAYCRRDELSPDDELLLTQTYLSAAAYMDAAGVSEPADSGRKATYDLCVNYLVADAMDRRAREVSGSSAENRSFRLLLNQLKQSEPVPESGTGG
jgi:hypothetical protein|nr:MAG TPA: hypothetical protein [Caudoviricetes sp.]